MTQKETDIIFNRITSNGCREMCEIRFHQAVNEILETSIKPCPLCGEDMKGFVLTHYKCKKCNQRFTD